MSRDTLPSSVTPSHYVLRLKPDLVACTFEGTVDITIAISEETQTICMHALDVDIKSVMVRLHDSNSLIVCTSQKFDEKSGQVELRLSKALPAASQGSLQIKFTGTLNDKMAGFYRSKYTAPDGSGEQRYMAVTQFEATDARRCFPCFDEPALKASFDVTLVVPHNRVALSNTHIVNEKSLDDTHREITYATTPKMSTYLLAFVIGEFEFVEDKTAADVIVRVYTQIGVKESGKFALQMATRTLDYFADYFAIPYPLKKLDLIAIPDFAAGAMENWGLVTYRNVMLLFNEATTPLSLKQRIAYVIAHELAHQWFGNLCTMEWWTDLWLNEGFATYAGWMAVEDAYPKWKVFDQFVSSEMFRGFQLDGLVSSHPIEVEVANSAQVDEIFDAISYCKGACIIRQLVSYMGEAAFQTGMRAYLKKHAFANAKTADLWAALGEASKLPIADMMEVWTKTTGYPVVSVSSGAKDNDNDDGSLALTQRRFLSTGPLAADADSPVWCVPLRMRADGTQPGTELFESAAETIVRPAKAWLKLNADQSAFYRVHYDTTMRFRLVDELRKRGDSATLSVSDRLGLINDAFVLATAGYASTTDFLQLLSAYRGEREYVVCAEIVSSLSSLSFLWSGEEQLIKDRIGELSMSIVEGRALQLGWEVKAGESHLDALLRPIVVNKAGVLGHKKIVAEGKERFARFCAGDADALHPDMRAAAYRIALRTGGADELDALFKVYREASTFDAKVVVLSALGATLDPLLARRVLDFALSDEVRAQDVTYPIASCAANPALSRLTWDFVKEKWSVFYDRYYDGAFLLGRLVQATAERLISEEAALEVEAFFKEHPAPAIDRPIRQSIERIRAQAQWLSRDRESVNEWLRTSQWLM